MTKTRLENQIDFIVEIDKLKHILRKTYLNDKSRHENDAEHSWHLAVMALLLSEYAEEKHIDINRVVKMVLIHDIVEIDAGDTFCYDEERQKGRLEKEIDVLQRKIVTLLYPLKIDLAVLLRFRDFINTMEEIANLSEDAAITIRGLSLTLNT